MTTETIQGNNRVKQEQLQLTGGNNNKDRRALDFYPTPKEVTIALMEYLNLRDKSIWEPACGDGAMSVILERYDNRVYSTDLRDTGFGIGGVDFLSHLPAQTFDAIITNPPFDQSHLFIEKALQRAPIVAMLLKSQYWHAKKRLELFRKQPPTYVLPLTWRPDFLNGEKGGAPTMEVAWSVWIRGDYQTKYVPLEKPCISPHS
jgi:hypothetical protein